MVTRVPPMVILVRETVASSATATVTPVPAMKLTLVRLVDVVPSLANWKVWVAAVAPKVTSTRPAPGLSAPLIVTFAPAMRFSLETPVAATSVATPPVT